VNRIRLAGALTALLLAGCPLPQPLPDYPPGSVTPPRIVMDEILVDGVKAQSSAIVRVPADCTGAKPSYALSARLVDTNTLEQVVARWFVDYLATDTVRRRPRQWGSVPSADSQTDLFRTVTAFEFVPYDVEDPVGNLPKPSPGIVHVVELVVTNNFDPAGVDPGEDAEPPYRGTLAGFETQTYRWVFVNAATGPDLRCPEP
jgi:hypothetical protein